MLKTTLSATDKKILSCAALDAYSLSTHCGFLVPPYYRFAFLRYFQVDEQALYEELVARSLAAPTATTRNFVDKLYESMTRYMPKGLRKLAAERRAPKTKAEEALFELVLAVGGVTQVYENPHIEQGFEMLSDPETKAVIEAAVATASSVSEISEFLTEACGVEFNDSAVVFYQWVFGDFSRMRPKDLKAYIRPLDAHHSRLLTSAFNSTVHALRVELGLMRDLSLEDTYQMAEQEATRRLFETLNSPVQADSREFRDSLRSFMQFVDRADRKGAGDANAVPAIFNSMRVLGDVPDPRIFNMPRLANAEEDTATG